jgi:hypothetical protein
MITQLIECLIEVAFFVPCLFAGLAVATWFFCLVELRAWIDALPPAIILFGIPIVCGLQYFDSSLLWTHLMSVCLHGYLTGGLAAPVFVRVVRALPKDWSL